MKNKEQIELRTKLRKKYNDEKVFVVPTPDIPPMVEGFVGKGKQVLPILYDYGFFADRWEVEHNPIVRQPIPYIIVKSGKKYFAMERLQGAGEERLHNQISLGVGGHINPIDDNKKYKYDALFVTAMWRELSEEIIIPESMEGKYEFLGFINDNSNDVSRDHLGLVYLFEIYNEVDIKVRETNKYKGKLYTLEELEDKYEYLESWSKIIFDVLKVL